MSLKFGGLVALLISFSLACTKDNPNKAPVADAGASAIVNQPVDTVTLQGSGKDEDGSVVAYAWEQVSGPSRATIDFDGSATTTVRNFSAGTYVFQLMVVDDKGATGVDTVSVRVIPPKIDSILLTAGGTGYLDKTFAQWNGADASDSVGRQIAALAWTKNSLPVIYRGALQFNLAAIPAGAHVTSAFLSLYSDPTPDDGNFVDANYGLQNSFYIRRNLGGWGDNTPFDQQPATTTDHQIIVPTTAQSRLDLIGIDVSALVQDMISNGNYGFMLQLVTEEVYNDRIFCGARYPDASKHPTLKVVFER